MATLIPETYTVTWGGMPGTTALIERYGDGWRAVCWDDYRQTEVTPYRSGSLFVWGLHGAHVFDTPEDAADAAVSALWL